MNLAEAYEAVKLAQQEFDANPCTRTADALDSAYEVFESIEKEGPLWQR